MKLARSYKSFVQLDTEIIAVGPDRKSAFEKFFTAQRIPFPGVPDPQQTILETYGQQSSLIRFGRLPAQLLIDKKGVVRFADYGKSMRDIAPVDELINFLVNMERET